ncbi:5-(carboxyamino)imidazole ribonucleotide synthase [Alkalithermobacter thermoalcaliphilus JW-YL-7 = DSM 7308]|uniref:N5-carboxyaminoimidazole ribonucleotide synthase n=1 Tax=Alkalithermobacter thermoalcaliphilus JW-YL-7 = DSM 7308 TaxID=1121328 RepID=A0A150FRV6_CLOPD|nr:phosphoribosylaminoimidazole carboxylase, ATPase subunit [[Clostridium] paradoxum JW-YL-7 = DSM 7308]SHK37828.1 5-(carboxyamino)imidazole ribonucleotide synthase [[Clostridium] paradoxum JW-YL-7 = DSM 7308]
MLNKKVGIIGGGQLGKMLIIEALKMGVYTVILDPDPKCPASYIANEHIIASFYDENALRELASKVDVVTYEFEHINANILKNLENEGFRIYPSPNTLCIIQNKYSQKKYFKENNIPVGDFREIKCIDDIEKVSKEFGYPVMLKSALGGYDGKGNSLIKSQNEIDIFYKELGEGKIPLYIEKYIPYKKEVSVICCKGINNDIKIYPVGENVHKDSILFETSVPADITKDEYEKSINISKDILNLFDDIGIFCIEMFITKDGDVLVNEVAPRPHNSGHYSIEGCVTSQFENHLRSVLGIPLGDVSLVRPVVMRNILGEDGYKGKPTVVGVCNALSIEGVSLHIYGKSETNPKRKMGHVTAIADTLDDARNKVSSAYNFIKVISK